LSRLGHTGGNTRDDHVDRDGEESGEDSGEGVLSTTVLRHLDHLLNEPADEIHPRHGSREGETRNDRVEGLSLELLGHEIDGLKRLGGHVRHCEFYNIYVENIIRVIILLFVLNSCISVS